jgi:segregation and condensation protein A
VQDAGSSTVLVARFLALLELYREGVVAFDQVTPLGELTIRWTGGDAEVTVVDDYDDGPQTDAGPPAAAPAEEGERDDSA